MWLEDLGGPFRGWIPLPSVMKRLTVSKSKIAIKMINRYRKALAPQLGAYDGKNLLVALFPISKLSYSLPTSRGD